MKKLLKIYMPFRDAITFFSTIPGFFVFWLVAGAVIHLLPAPIAEAIRAGVAWLINDVVLLGYGEEMPAVANFLTALLPFISAMLLCLVENITGLWIPVYRAKGLPLE